MIGENIMKTKTQTKKVETPGFDLALPAIFDRKTEEKSVLELVKKNPEKAIALFQNLDTQLHSNLPCIFRTFERTLKATEKGKVLYAQYKDAKQLIAVARHAATLAKKKEKAVVLSAEIQKLEKEVPADMRA